MRRDSKPPGAIQLKVLARYACSKHAGREGLYYYQCQHIGLHRPQTVA